MLTETTFAYVKCLIKDGADCCSCGFLNVENIEKFRKQELYRLILNESLDVGSQIPYIRRALANDWGVIVCNTNTDQEIHDYARRHLCAVYDQLLKDSSGQRIFVVAHSRGGVDIAHALPYFQNETRFEVVCLTDSLDFELPRCSSTENSAGGTVFINWKANSELQKAALVEEDLLGLYPRIQQVYAGCYHVLIRFVRALISFTFTFYVIFLELRIPF
ncbi:hypothetical protein OESDEN_18985 [Oesophagostomum dentatum]|uniref:GPI inositol-deacylase n=1 Tax=Oesophagostomum dentatum TaxID=61180 RepID=A0A0B1S8Q7_OESDE|nr:hypothetical protein OESDEN_18985 [Oesophagostomum dentatum]